MGTPRASRRLLVLLAVVAAHTAVLVLLQEDDRRRLFKDASDNEPTMVWLPPLAEEHESESAAAPRTPPAQAAAVPPAQATEARPARAAAPRPAPPTEPNQPQPPDIDWNRELGAAARNELARNERKRQQESVFTAPHAPPGLAATAPRPPQFQWDYAATHRVEHTPGGTLYININDRCLYVFPILFVCRIGEIAPHTHLLDHAKDLPLAD